jgi:hypothetical protein
MSISEYFSDSYADARAKFAAAAQAAGASIEPYVLPGTKGPSGEELAIDVAVLGPANADRALFLISGTHGVEGFCGSGCQVGFLRDRLYEALPRSTVSVLVHAVNPYGFAWLRRVNEDNVDLNRNFRDFTQPVPSNTEYESLHQWLLPADWDGAARQAADAALEHYVNRHGTRAFHAAVGSGQYSRSNGLFYGGVRETWSTRTFRDIVNRFVPTRIKKLAGLEFHTGLGPLAYGEPMFLGGSEAGLRRTRSWFGPEVTDLRDAAAGSPVVLGPLATSFDQVPSGTEVTYLALEYGTTRFMDIVTALRADNWLHTAENWGSPLRTAIKREIRDAFYVDAAPWKAAVYGRAADFVLRASRGLADRGC